MTLPPSQISRDIPPADEDTATAAKRNDEPGVGPMTASARFFAITELRRLMIRYCTNSALSCLMRVGKAVLEDGARVLYREIRPKLPLASLRDKDDVSLLTPIPLMRRGGLGSSD